MIGKIYLVDDGGAPETFMVPAREKVLPTCDIAVFDGTRSATPRGADLPCTISQMACLSFQPPPPSGGVVTRFMTSRQHHYLRSRAAKGVVYLRPLYE